MKITCLKIIGIFFAGLCLTGYVPTTDLNDSTITDLDGNVYTTVKIGDQVWTVENLRTTKYNDGTSIKLGAENDDWSKPIPQYCWYSNDIQNKAKYGALYNWYAVNTGKLAPKGWHIPTKAELDTLKNYLINNGFNWDLSKSGNKIAKSMASQDSCWDHWGINDKFYDDFYEEYYTPHPGIIGTEISKNNSSGFSAIPGGFRNNLGAFFMKGEMFYSWSSTISEKAIVLDNNRIIQDPYSYSLSSEGYEFIIESSPHGSGNSVRLIKDK